MGAVLSIATILGGIVAVWYIWDKYKDKRKWDEREKVVNSNWWESSELKHALENQGYKFRWSDRSRIQERKENEYEVIYEQDFSNRVKYMLINNSGQVLIGKKGT